MHDKNQLVNKQCKAPSSRVCSSNDSKRHAHDASGWRRQRDSDAGLAGHVLPQGRRKSSHAAPQQHSSPAPSPASSTCSSSASSSLHSAGHCGGELFLLRNHSPSSHQHPSYANQCQSQSQSHSHSHSRSASRSSCSNVRHQQAASQSPVAQTSDARATNSNLLNKSSNSHSSGNPNQAQATGSKASQHSLQPSADSLRYEYDDHYFLTDPSEFIYEFYPLSPEWQLLKSRPITLSEFEELPFVRSLFFKYGLYFPQPSIRSTLFSDTSGTVSIKIGMPTQMIPNLIFHYNLKYYDSDAEHYDGISLKRFVMQSVESGNCNDGSANTNSQVLLSNIVSFRVHLPQVGAFILDIFANSTTPTQYITGEPMKFKSVCKFKIVSKHLKTVMIPLPNCASGEFGPLKATRLFGLIPISHENGLICFQANSSNKRRLEIQFRMTRPLLDFMASLHKNNCDEKRLANLISIVTDNTIVTIQIKFIESGQYGLDLYTRDNQSLLEAASQDSATTSIANGASNCASGDASSSSSQRSHHHKKQLLTHCCKYLINVKGLSS